MTDQELIQKIKELKQIKPSQDWVVSCKNRILSEEQENREFEQSPALTNFGFLRFVSDFVRDYKLTLKPVLVTAVCFGIIVGLFGFTQNTVPGDFFYSVKKVKEITQVAFSPDGQKSIVYLQFANKRLEDLKKIAESNDVRNLAPCLEDFQANISEAAKDLVKIDVNVTSSDPSIIKGIVKQTQELEKKKAEVKTFGIVLGENKEWENAVADFVETQINGLEGMVEKEQLEEIKQLEQEGNFTAALEKILFLSY